MWHVFQILPFNFARQAHCLLAQFTPVPRDIIVLQMRLLVIQMLPLEPVWVVAPVTVITPLPASLQGHLPCAWGQPPPPRS